jgi:hypothetical protein
MTPRLRRLALLALAAAAVACVPPHATRQATSMAPARVNPLPERTLLRGVAESNPAALAGGLGAHPMVWILADARDSVLGSATGRARIAHDSTGAELVTWSSAADMLPGMPASASPGDLLRWGRIAAGDDTVDVIWVRLASGTPVR